MKKHYVLRAIVCLAFFFLVHPSRAQNLADIKKEIEKDNALYFDLFKKNDSTIVNLYTDDGCLMPPSTPAICGRAALTKDFKDTYAAGKVKGVKFATLRVYGAGKE